MKLNLQRSPLYVYMFVSNHDGFKIIPVFDDIYETDVKYNINSNKNVINFSLYLEKPKVKFKKLKTNFYSEYFSL